MKYVTAAVSIVVCIGFIAVALAQDSDHFEAQGELMKCSQPTFILVADVDMAAKAITAMATKEKNNPDRDLFGYHMTFKFADIHVTNSRRVAVDENKLSSLKGKLVLLYDGKEPLNALYLGLFREDTIVISRVPENK